MFIVNSNAISCYRKKIWNPYQVDGDRHYQIIKKEKLRNTTAHVLRNTTRYQKQNGINVYVLKEPYNV